LTVVAVAGGRYVLRELIGHGGMAVVHLAHDTELDRPVAVKLLAENLAADPEFRERFVRETRLAARLAHANVVRVYDAGEDGDRPYIVMEYVAGETLAQLLARERKVAPGKAAALIRQAALGLEHAHAAGLVHRDVKPQNLLLRRDGVLKVADFGIARAAETTRLTRVGTILGTAAYLSPEQALGEDVTAAADIYSLGAVLYELLTGRVPFASTSLAELAQKQRSGEVVPVRDLEPTVPDSLEALVMQCLARDPRFRPSSAHEVAVRLGEEPVTALLDSPTAATVRLPARMSQTVPGTGTWVWLAAALLLGALALIVGIVRAAHDTAAPAARTPTVAPIPHGATPAEEARNLSRWLNRYSR
jgi:serine/threonine protein kinase